MIVLQLLSSITLLYMTYMFVVMWSEGAIMYGGVRISTKAKRIVISSLMVGHMFALFSVWT